MLALWVLVLLALLVLYFMRRHGHFVDRFHEGGKDSGLPFYLGRSPIHGVGVFPTRPFHPGKFLFEIIDPETSITSLGRKINHCWKPNTKLVKNHDGSWWLVSFSHIARGEELTVDYRDTPSFIKKPPKHWKC